MFGKIKTWHHSSKTRSRFVVFLSVIIMSLITTGAVYDATCKKVTLTEVNVFDNIEKSSVVKTRKATVSEVLKENNITVGQYDNLNVLLDDQLANNLKIIVRQGKTFTLITSDGEKTLSTTKATVKEALEESGFSLNDCDEVSPERNELITDNLAINVVRVTSEDFETTENVAFDIDKIDDANMYKGDEKVVCEGVEGQKQVVYKITYKDGAEVSREAVSEKITVPPVNKVVATGTKEKTVSVKSTKGIAAGALSSRGELRYKKKLTVTATAYDPSLASNGGHSKTYMGASLNFGVIAVDPRVIPLGSRVYIESSDDGHSWVYGYAIASDIGGAIKGNRIDLCYASASQARAFGRRTAVVYVLE